MKPISTDATLQFMPVLANKRPIHKKWEQTRTQYDFTGAEAVGLVCGEISGNVEAIDLDLKYDLTGKLFEEYKKIIFERDKTLLGKLTVQKTVSNGYHFIYRCDVIAGNLKLAIRETSQEEKENSYQRAYAKKFKELSEQVPVPENIIELATNQGIRERDNDKTRVLLETRGEKGYIACYPTKGYELVHGSFDNIQKITPEQREILFSAAYSFNEVLTEYVPPERIEKKQIKGLSPSEDYNQRGDVVGLLVSHGWKEVGRKGKKILMQRPGDTKADHSGNFDEERNWFSVFSTSTEFEPQKSYQPYAVFAVLECNKDFKLAPIKLYEAGFGDRREALYENVPSIPSAIDLTDDDLSFLATPEDYDDYLHRWRTGTFEKGKPTGMPGLDKYFLFKESDLVIINGIDNVGKSTVIWYLAMISSMLHDWKWLIFSSENKVGGVVRKLIEFYWSEPIASMSEERFQIAKKYVQDNFGIIKCKDSLYNVQDILNMTTKALKKQKYRGLMIDPYNSLKVDIPGKSKQSTYDYHYEAASILQLYGKQNNLSIYLNCHVGTVGARNKDKSGFTKAPQKEDTEMGVMFANKADEFLTIHRVTQHETEWMFTELHVRKVKETETGGRVTPFHAPVIMRMVSGLSGFEQTTFKNIHEVGVNPVLKFHAQEKPVIPNPNKNLEPSKAFDDEPEWSTEPEEYTPF